MEPVEESDKTVNLSLTSTLHPVALKALVITTSPSLILLVVNLLPVTSAGKAGVPVSFIKKV